VVFRLALFLLAILLISFAVSNRGTVAVGLWPLPYLADVPLYLIVFLSLLIGVLGGASAAWIAGRRNRRELRNRRWRIEALERELAAMQSRLGNHSDPPMINLPVES
jgi:uncharacterized integral membrane protein